MVNISLRTFSLVLSCATGITLRDLCLFCLIMLFNGLAGGVLGVWAVSGELVGVSKLPLSSTCT